MDVYVLTAPDNWRSATSEALVPGDGGFVASSFMEFSLADADGQPPTLDSLLARFPTPESMHRAVRAASIGRISVSNGTLDEFCHALERTLDRPVVDETRIEGRHDFELSGDPAISPSVFATSWDSR